MSARNSKNAVIAYSFATWLTVFGLLLSLEAHGKSPPTPVLQKCIHYLSRMLSTDSGYVYFPAKNFPSFSKDSVVSKIGVRRVGSFLKVPKVGAINKNLKLVENQSSLFFVTGKDGGLDPNFYGNLQSQRRIYIGNSRDEDGGIFNHDVLDHAPGYVMLSESEGFAVAVHILETAHASDQNFRGFFARIVGDYLEALSDYLSVADRQEERDQSAMDEEISRFNHWMENAGSLYSQILALNQNDALYWLFNEFPNHIYPNRQIIEESKSQNLVKDLKKLIENPFENPLALRAKSEKLLAGG